MARKAKTGLNKKGIRLLADDLVAHEKMYDQNTYGQRYTNKNACQTFCCMAGLCKVRKIGLRAFNKLASDWHARNSGGSECAPAGKEQLGLEDIDFPQIFDDIYRWPRDLYQEYESNGPRWRVIAALKSLQRLLPDGTIDENPKAVHTRLPQLATLLKKTKPVKA